MIVGKPDMLLDAIQRGERRARDAHHDSSSQVPNNVVEQDDRAIKRITRPMLGFKDFRCARMILSGIEVMHMIRKGQMKTAKETARSAAEQFYCLIK